MANPEKDTIYIDIDDEITAIIDKLKNSGSKVVALVLPKRATVFQSIVNMKLLKKAADSGKKNVVLITAETGLLPLAGAAGIHVAKTLTSKPEIPSPPLPIKDSNEAYDEDAETIIPSDDDDVDPTKTVGQLAGSDATASAALDNSVETVDLDNTEPEADKDKADKAPPKDKSTKDKKLKVPNFNRFRKYLIIGFIVIIALIIIFLVVGSSFDKATINVSTNSSNINTNLNLNLSTSAKNVDVSSDTIPAQLAQAQKTYSQQVTTTGQENQGNKASGSITVSGGSCGPTAPSDVPAGTGVTSNNLTYITQDDITFQASVSHGKCTFEGVDSSTNQSNIPITAQNGGSNYNTSGTPFTISSNTTLSATGTASGGTDNIVQTVNQNDINSAKSKISTSDSSEQSSLESQLKGEGYYPINSTYTAGTPNVTSSASVGEVANNVTVTETVSYTMFGVHESDLKTLVDNSVDGQIDTSKQSILSEGLDNATFNPNTLTSTGGQVSMSTVAIAGPQLNISSIQKAAEGQKAAEIESQINSDPGVTNVKVKISPFWASTAPNSTTKIVVNIAKPTNTKSSN